MTRFVRAHARWGIVVAFALGMAWVESACVYYLRVLVDRVQPYQANPLPMHGGLGEVELVREAATLVMLITIGVLAGRTTPARLGYAAVAFGVWDIAYYVFLWMMSGWPASLLDWDILFLLPLPWWGPVLAPVSIAALMIVGGTAVTESARATRVTISRAMHVLAWLGIGLALYVFMADALRAAGRGGDVRTVLPVAFNWLLFSVAFMLMAVPVIRILLLLRHLEQPAGIRVLDDPHGAVRSDGHVSDAVTD